MKPSQTVFTGIFVSLLCIAITPFPLIGGSEQGNLNCNMNLGPCKSSLPGCTVTLDINPKPVTTMQDLRFTVTLSGKHPQANPYIDLGMPGMDMGPNRVLLKPSGNEVYEGGGVIVRCPSGGRVWKALVTIPDLGKAEFIFEVAH